MSKTTLSEIKHLIYKNKTKKEQNSSEKDYSEPIKISSDEHSNEQLASAALSSKDTNRDIILQDLEIGHTNKSVSKSSTYFSINMQDTTDSHKENLLSYSHSCSRQPISPEDEELLKKNEGKSTIKELSEKFNIPASVLYYWAKKNHYQPKRGNANSPISDELQEKLLSQLNTMSMAELARENNIPYYTLYYWLRKQGLTAKKASEFPIHTQQELRKKCEVYSLKDLAKEYHLSEQTMRSRLQNIGCFPDGKGIFSLLMT